MTQNDLFDFSGMNYNPSCKGRIVDEYPELKLYPEFMEMPYDSCLCMVPSDFDPEQCIDQVVKFAFAYASRESPLFRIKDMAERRRLGEIIAGCGDNARLCIELRDDSYSKILYRVYKLECAYDLQEYMSSVELLHNWTMMLRSSVEDSPAIIEKQIKVRAELPKLRLDIEAMEKNLFADKQAAQEFVTVRDASELVGYAERMARQYKKDAIF